jgi:hypothetical protein
MAPSKQADMAASLRKSIPEQPQGFQISQDYRGTTQAIASG